MGSKVEERVLYDVYKIADDHAVLPEGGSLSQVWDRIRGNRVVEVVDVNGDGPGSGDTAILFTGDKIEDIRFQGPPLIHKLAARREFYLNLARRELAATGAAYDVRNINPASLEGFAVALAGSMQNYGSDRVEEAREIAHSITDHPVAAGAIVAGATALSLHPKGRLAMEAVGLSGAVGGTGYILHDRVNGIVNDKPMGKHDLAAGLCMAGGVSALRGMTVEGFWNDTVQGLKTAGRFLGESVDSTPGLVAVGANGESFIVSNAAVVSAVAAAAATGGRVASAAGALPVSRMVATFANGGGKIQTREVQFSEEFVPDEVAWAQSLAKKSAEEIKAALELMMEEGEAAQAAQVLEEVEQNLEVTAEFYKRADPAFRQVIQKTLAEVEAQALHLLDRPNPREAEMILNGVRHKIGALKETASRYRLASFKMPGNEKAAALPDVPEGIDLGQPLERMLPRNPETRRRFVDVLERYFRNFRGGSERMYKKLTGPGEGLTEVKFMERSGPRIYLVFNKGRPVLLRVGNKDTQMQDILAAKALAKKLGFLQVFVYFAEATQDASETAGSK